MQWHSTGACSGIVHGGAADGFSWCKDIEEVLDLYEHFYTLEALSEPWGHGAHFKCICEDYFKDGTCHHSLMLSLLCKDKDALPFTMPAEYRTRGVPSHLCKQCRLTSSTATTLGDSKGLNMDSDNEELEQEPKVSSV